MIVVGIYSLRQPSLGRLNVLMSVEEWLVAKNVTAFMPWPPVRSGFRLLSSRVFVANEGERHAFVLSRPETRILGMQDFRHG